MSALALPVKGQNRGVSGFCQSLEYCKGAFSGLFRCPPGNVPGLDFLRTLAILLVFSGHFGGEFGTSADVQRFPLVYFGWTGVDLFFVLSGFLIGMQIWKEIQRSGTVRIGRFLMKRGYRIWPLYVSFILLVAFESLFLGRNSSGIWADVGFVSNYFHHQVGGGWSLATEEQFYIIFPLLILLLLWKFKPRRLVTLPLAALALLPISRALTIHFSSASISDVRAVMYGPIHTHADGLAVGVLIAWVQVFRPGVLDGMRRWIAVSVMFALGMTLYLVNRDVFNFSALGLIFGGSMLAVVGFNPAVFQWRGFYLISRLSYGIYLNHFGLMPRIVGFLQPWRGKGAIAFFGCYFVTFLTCLAFAALTFLAVENPFLRLRERHMASFKQSGSSEKRHRDLPSQVELVPA